MYSNSFYNTGLILQQNKVLGTKNRVLKSMHELLLWFMILSTLQAPFTGHVTASKMVYVGTYARSYNA